MIRALTPRIAEIISGPPQGLAHRGRFWAPYGRRLLRLEGYRTVLNRAYHVLTPPSYIFRWRRLWSIAQILILSFSIVCAMIVLVLVLPIASGETLHGGLRQVHQSERVSHGRQDNPHLRLAGDVLRVPRVSYYVLPNIRQNFHSVWHREPHLVTGLMDWRCTVVVRYICRSFQQVNLIYGSLGGFPSPHFYFSISAT